MHWVFLIGVKHSFLHLSSRLAGFLAFHQFFSQVLKRVHIFAMTHLQCDIPAVKIFIGDAACEFVLIL